MKSQMIATAQTQDRQVVEVRWANLFLRMGVALAVLYALQGSQLAHAVDRDGTSKQVTLASPAQNQSGSTAAGNIVPLAPTPSFQSGDESTVFKDPTKLSSTEQKQAYERANEINELQVVYIQKSLDAVNPLVAQIPKDNSQAMPNDTNDPSVTLVSEIEHSTNGFCKLSDNPQPSDYSECLQEYRAARLEQLRDLRSAIQKNQNNLASLLSVQKGVDGKRNTPFDRNPSFSSKVSSPLYPKIPSYLDLTRVADDLAAASRSNSIIGMGELRKSQVKQFVAGALAPPKPEDYLKTHKVYPDSDKPGAATIDVVEQDAEGRPILDSRAYQAALEQHNRMMAKLGSGDKKTLQQKLEKKMLGYMEAQEGQKVSALKEKRNVLRAQASDLPVDPAQDRTSVRPGKCDNLDSQERYNYCLARSFITEYFNGEAPDSQGQPSSGSARVLASTPGAKSKPTIQASEAYELSPSIKNPDAAINGQKPKENTESLYMDTGYIDEVMKQNDN